MVVKQHAIRGIWWSWARSRHNILPSYSFKFFSSLLCSSLILSRISLSENKKVHFIKGKHRWLINKMVQVATKLWTKIWSLYKIIFRIFGYCFVFLKVIIWVVLTWMMWKVYLGEKQTINIALNVSPWYLIWFYGV